MVKQQQSIFEIFHSTELAKREILGGLPLFSQVLRLKFDIKRIIREFQLFHGFLGDITKQKTDNTERSVCNFRTAKIFAPCPYLVFFHRGTAPQNRPKRAQKQNFSPAKYYLTGLPSGAQLFHPVRHLCYIPIRKVKTICFSTKS